MTRNHSSFRHTLSVLGPLGLVVAVALAAATGNADTITVCWDGSGDCATIQDGLDAAADGDEVVVCDGTYRGNGNRGIHVPNKAVTLRSANGPLHCRIDGEGDAVFHVYDSVTPLTVIEGFTIYNAGGLRCVYSAISCSRSSPTIRNCWIVASQSPSGGAISLTDNSNPTIVNCIISGNRADEMGGGILCYDNSNPTIVNCTIVGNSADYGGGILCVASQPTVQNCILWGNSAYHGKEIALLGDPYPPSTLTVSYCDVEGGEAGVYVAEGSTLIWGDGNTLDDPLFLQPDRDNLHLSPGSPCIDAADNDAVPPDVTTDFDRYPRFVDDAETDDSGNGVPPIVDMGAYEFQGSAVPTPPPNVRASDGVYTEYVVVAWDASPQATEYRVFRSVENDPELAEPVSYWRSTTTYYDWTPDPGQVYWYWVKARNDFGESGFGESDDGFRWQGPPPPPDNVEASDGAYLDRIDVTWNAAPTATGYRLYRNTDDDPGGAAPISDWLEEPGFVDTTGEPGITYWYWAAARNENGEGDFSTSDSGHIWSWPPPPPTGLDASDGTDFDRVTINWETAPFATAYRLYRYVVDDPHNAAPISDWQEGTTFVDLAVAQGVVYWYWVKARGQYGESDWSASDTGFAYLPGTLRVPSEYATVQEAINAARPAETVLVADGVYTGPGNRDLDFQGKPITVRSANGPAACVIDCRQEGRGFYFHNAEQATSVVEGFTITNGLAERGAGIYCEGSRPTIRNCIISACRAVGEEALGGAICAAGGAPTISGCTIYGNRSDADGGGLASHHSDLRLRNSLIYANDAANRGGGLWARGLAHGTVIGNCTISGNTAGHTGGGLFVPDYSRPKLNNCIVWDNAPDEIGLDDFGAPLVRYCDVRGGWSGDGNIDVDPAFVDPQDGDYHVYPGSPCIDAGDPGFIAQQGETDIDGQLRLWDGDDDGVRVVDMGCDEFGSILPGDLNIDGCVDHADLGILLGDWDCAADCVGDLDYDDDTDHGDLSILLAHWGDGCE